MLANGLTTEAATVLLHFAEMTGDDDVTLADYCGCKAAADRFGVPLRTAYFRAKSLGLLGYQAGNR